jgi:hypothetical protein
MSPFIVGHGRLREWRSLKLSGIVLQQNLDASLRGIQFGVTEPGELNSLIEKFQSRIE